MLAVIRIRGKLDKSKEVKETFERLRLRRKHVCVLLPENESNKGMIHKVKDFVTYGEINKETLKELLEKRGKLAGDNKITSLKEDFIDSLMAGKAKLADAGIKPFFRLAPPRQGFGKIGIKKGFAEKGALGYRGKEINALLKKMM
ncbi:MAG TPA: 50S ribosomal protein L30 [Nanoarchaeota archaeon]|nr:MAG: 50S ribosomal protein L30, large subunit ribosomal protein L30 [archaeon GW2011_AR6]MBS3082781.1 50S ribosomal protein L30 [Candidatus Pacearchaeota archaeon]HIH17835.1 50S ribosomal protein L30 [Nanoarchaeota archaeon]HIH34091.1 50S ribosomal protein L30 [Nanoarchaeota archaeon]HIH50952.1 50S ribosomal protein L30 [Nanoarchaeota archaeon]